MKSSPVYAGSTWNIWEENRYTWQHISVKRKENTPFHSRQRFEYGPIPSFDQAKIGHNQAFHPDNKPE